MTLEQLRKQQSAVDQQKTAVVAATAVRDQRDREAKAKRAAVVSAQAQRDQAQSLVTKLTAALEKAKQLRERVSQLPKPLPPPADVASVASEVKAVLAMLPPGPGRRTQAALDALQRSTPQTRAGAFAGLLAAVDALPAEIEASRRDAARGLAAAESDLQKSSRDAAVADQALAQAKANAAAADATLTRLRTQLTQALDALIPALDRYVPLVLLPVRLETRFRPTDAQKQHYDLLIRIYPDDIHQDTFEPELTAAEIEWGNRYHGRLHGSPEEVQVSPEEAWAQLAGRFGPQRAAWVAYKAEETHGELQSDSPKAAAWSRAPHTQTLPDRWIAVLSKRGGGVRTEYGRVIRQPLETGPAPLAGDEAEDGMRWMVDFRQAVDEGMGIIYTNLSRDEAESIECLLVFGVKATLDSGRSAYELSTLLKAHHYTSGLGLLPQWTPTNNTTDERAGHSARTPDAKDSFAIERGAPLFTSGSGLDGDVLASALGLSADVLTHVEHADGTDQQDAAVMNTVLWPATWRYFLRQMMWGARGNVPLDTWRRFFIDRVRGRGPLPAVRVGRQPYGVLPVTALDHWRPVGGTLPPPPPSLEASAGLVSLLIDLRDRWQQAAEASVPFVGRNSRKPDDDLLETLSMGAVSSHYYTRYLVGKETNDRLYKAQNQTLPPQFAADVKKLVDAQIGNLRVQGPPRLAECVYPFSWASSVDLYPIVQYEPLSETEPLTRSLAGDKSYIRWLAEATPEEIHDASEFAPDKDAVRASTLLYRLLRHATLNAYADAVYRLSPHPPEGFPHGRIDEVSEPEFVYPTPPRNTPWRAITSEWAYFLHTHRDALPVDDPFNEFIRGLETLDRKPSAALERLMRESLDLSAHRLDAWVTAVATQRLNEIRRQFRTAGVYLGGYGWVEKPHPRERPVSSGYVHAPSLAHGAAAALLRSGYLTHEQAADGRGLAIDLSSRRVRLALWFVDGIRQGQSAGSLLGYRFERGLHARNLDKYISVFRGLYPLVAGKLTPTTQAVEELAVNQVVDGLALVDAFRRGSVFGNQGLPSTGKDHVALNAALADLDDVADAVNDLALSESIFQAVRGNPVRTGASLDAASNAEALPPEFEVVQTPRTGKTFTHRLLVLLDPKGTAGAGWDNSRPRARAEPALNAWVARLLPPPEKVTCAVQYHEPPANDVVKTMDVSLANLSLCPLDVLYMHPLSAAPGLSELEQRVLAFALSNKPADVSKQARASLVFARGKTFTPQQFTFPEALEIARLARELISQARPLTGEDFRLPGVTAQAPMPVLRFQVVPQATVDRLQNAIHDLRKWFEISPVERAKVKAMVSSQVADTVNLTNLLDLPGSVDLQAVCQELDRPFEAELPSVQTALLILSGYIPEALPPLLTAPGAPDRNALIVRARVAHAEAQRRLKMAGQAADAEKLRCIFGEGFVSLPTLHLPNAKSLGDAFSDREKAGDAQSVHTRAWLQSMAKVRAGAARLERSLLLAETLGTGDRRDLRIGQIPIRQGGTVIPWIGNLGRSVNAPNGTLSLALHMPTNPDLAVPFEWTKPLTGLWIDEWVETVPAERETTGLAFHYDAPGACAPQAILLAVNPDLSRTWTVETLKTILLETLNLAHIRAVDVTAMGRDSTQNGVGHFVPALFFATNDNGDTVATTTWSNSQM